ncbi:TIM-barrel domain-containing protein [Flavisolibacter nicotianae]|uniref:TIM-barrel domain-containing protein n=1 Tax=Flavisolibacter nicotianae TaxID=2364882 RepID=UPI000EAD6610|nr:TIM-barrel domain-containing protein [Flavisolibacter nicotianae]
MKCIHPSLVKAGCAAVGFLLFSFSVFAGDFTRTSDGLIVHPDAPFSGGATDVQLKVIADNIIRVIAVADKKMQPDTSLVVLKQTPAAKWTVTNTKATVSLKTARLTAVVSLQTGAVQFFDAAGKKILAEKEVGRQLQPQVFEGKRLYSVRQDFATSSDDALYGLGQHQDAVMNYKGSQVLLWQNNTEVAVPFLLSKKNYGILWDNASVTQFGDVRPYQQLNALKLYSKDGDQGWLTATYSNDKSKPADAVLQKAESGINMEFLGDSKLILPAAFKPENGVVTWEGSIASEWNGVHKFRFTYGGYAKLWIDGKLLFDRWRQSWNPGSVVTEVALAKGEKHSFKLEWIPSGGESYLTAKFLPPQTEEERNSYSFASEAGKALDYYFIYGQNMDDVIAGYRKLTGKATLLPKWTFGFWQSRERYKTQKEIMDVVEEFRKRRIPLDNIVEDWSYWKQAEWGSQEFDEERFPNAESMIQALHNQYHAHFMISVWPKFYEGIPNYTDFNNKGWLYKRNIADRQRDWIAQGYISTFYDPFNPAAQKGFWDLLNKKLYTKGVDAWWMDASEPDILSNVSPQKRKEQMVGLYNGPAAAYLNAYPMQNAKGIYEGQRGTNPNTRVFILTRSAFAGQQRYAAATWSGDIASRWHDMKDQIAAGTNFSMSGSPYWTMDIGGFAVERRYERPNEEDLEEWRELNTRWFQFGTFVPLFRAHGQFPYREIFNIAPETHPAYQSMLYYNKLRYRLLPYIYSLAGAAYHNDGTLMRGLVMDFPKDTAVNNINDQYLFGPSLLINPVINYKQLSREVYLPKGAGWFDLYNGTFVSGGNRINADATYERMPVYVKAGSILPFGPELQYTSEKPAEEITLYVYSGADGSFNLYEDEGTNYNYEKGAFAVIPMKYNEAGKTLTIGERKGSFNGMLQQRRFNIVWVTKDNKAGIDVPHGAVDSVTYSGKTLTIKMK